MHNGDLKRLYKSSSDPKPGDFVRYNSEGKVPGVAELDERILNYTGDWVTNNDYHVHDVVTWAADGHLYEVLKDHKSSASIDPDNPEYYKAMTNKTFSEAVYDLSTQSSRNALLASIANMDHRPFVKIVGTVDGSQTEFSIASTTDTVAKFYAINFTASATYIYGIVVQSASSTIYKTTLDSDTGKVSISTTTIGTLTVTYMD